MKHLSRVLVLTLSVWFSSLPARAVSFHITYDSSVSNSGYFSSIQSALNVVTNTYHVLFTNSCTVNFTCYWGAVGPFSAGVSLGENECQEMGTFTYAQITNALRAARNSLADSNSVASLPAGDPVATNKWWVPRIQVKLLPSLASIAGISANDTINDGSVSFASDVPFTFSPTNRLVPGKVDFIGVAEHEISEMMGRTFGLNQYNGGVYLPYDLFRFTNVNARCFDINASGVYFSVNNGTNVVKWFYPDYEFTGDDPQDWESSTIPDSYDSVVTDSETLPLSPADLTAMDILGYNLPSFPSPKLSTLRLTNGTFRISFTNLSGAPFSVFACTNLLVNTTNWTYLGEANEISNGFFQYIDTPALANRQYFYQVRMP